MDVLEGHAVIVAKSLGGDIKPLAHILKLMGIKVEVEKLQRLVKEIQPELEPSIGYVVARRVAKFIEELKSQENTEEVVV